MAPYMKGICQYLFHLCSNHQCDSYLQLISPTSVDNERAKQSKMEPGNCDTFWECRLMCFFQLSFDLVPMV